jgi:hypothetical protein
VFVFAPWIRLQTDCSNHSTGARQLGMFNLPELKPSEDLLRNSSATVFERLTEK